MKKSKTTILKTIFISLGTLFIILAYNNCTDYKLNLKDPIVTQSAKGRFCTEAPKETDVLTKYLFVVDDSGSNDWNDPNNTGKMRAINNFYNSKKSNTKSLWSFIIFGGKETRHIMGKLAENESTFVKDQERINAALNRIQSGGQQMNTPYSRAMDQTMNLIAADISLTEKLAKQQNIKPEEATYIVFYISDGLPTDEFGVINAEKDTQSLLSLSPGNIYLSTAFYGTGGSSQKEADNGGNLANVGIGIELLSTMANNGNGKFVNFNNSENMNFNSLVPDIKLDPWFVKEVLVYNLNASFCDDGNVGLDSDADGLCDSEEEKLRPMGFDPYNHFSFNDGYGDLFHWRRVHNRMNLVPCTDRSDEDHDLLTKCEESAVRNDKPLEGYPSVADPLNPDSDRDGIIDGIEVLTYFRVTLAYAVSPTNLYRSEVDREDDDAGTQIKQHRSPIVVDPEADMYDTTISTPQIMRNGSTCYEFTQSNLPLKKTTKVSGEKAKVNTAHNEKENMILFYYIQVPQSSPDATGIYRYSFQNLEYNRALSDSKLGGLSLDNSTFNTYEIPE